MRRRKGRCACNQKKEEGRVGVIGRKVGGKMRGSKRSRGRGGGGGEGRRREGRGGGGVGEEEEDGWMEGEEGRMQQVGR